MTSYILQNALTTKLVNIFSTGNHLLDTLLIVLVTSIISCLLIAIKKINIIEIFYSIVSCAYKIHITTLEVTYTMSNNGWIADPIDSNNTILVDAIEAYLENALTENIYFHKVKLGKCIKLPDSDVYTNELTRPIHILPNTSVNLKSPFDGINIKLLINKTSNDKTEKINKSIIMKCHNNDKIVNFIKYCYDTNYVKKNYREEQKKIYFLTYTILSVSHTKRDDILWTKSPFAPLKSFDNIFFNEKKRLLTYLDNFLNKKLKTKFSLLLYGLPGTGKTSIIKALAKYTNRSILYVKLSNIKNFDCGFNIFYNENMSLRSVDSFSFEMYDLPINKRIIVLEDVDVESSITHDRKFQVFPKEITNNHIGNKENKEEKEDEKEINNKNTFNLSDLLQLLDGVYESEDTMIVMTTNDIDKLDSALIRYGRFNMRLNLGKLSKQSIIEMLNYNFPDQPMAKIINIIQDDKMTPAELENICMEAVDIDDVYDKIEPIMAN